MEFRPRTALTLKGFYKFIVSVQPITMKPRTLTVQSLFLLLLATYLSFHSLLPGKDHELKSGLPLSMDRTMAHVEKIAAAPHGVGFPAHKQVREYIMAELGKLGIEANLQQGYTSGDWANLSRVVNIVARIDGKGDGPALVLMSHYDSQPHSSYGASDAASGVAVILEGLRVFLEQGEQPENDIIILFTDAEELGLNGADLFVNQHPWAKDVGLVLNFEARGSGGPSYFLIETNEGNASLVNALIDAGLKYPVGNSLAYSIYKLLPNDTDLTVFREDRSIQGLNFAFIDDHFDYHTALDRPDRLDPETLAHQLEYLGTLLPYFANRPLELLSEQDLAYFNVPFFGLVTYPYSWNWVLWGLAVLGFVLLLSRMLGKGGYSLLSVLKGFGPLLLSLIGCGLLGYFIWPFLQWVYPGYGEMLHGFTYNGHWYILAAVALSLALLFASYAYFPVMKAAALLPAALFIWLLICGLLNYYLPGASFLIIPVFGLLAGTFIFIESSKRRPVVLALVTIPALWIMAPMLQMFPVGLGLGMLITATLMTALLYLSMLPFFLRSGLQRKLAVIALALGVGALLGAHLNASNDTEKPRPSSLIYLQDVDTEKAYWASTEKNLSEWTQEKFQKGTLEKAPASLATFSSKYGTRMRHFSEAPMVDVAQPMIEVLRDTIIEQERHLALQIRPQREVNRLEIFTNPVNIRWAMVNGTTLEEDFLANRGSRLFTHYISENDPTLLELVYPFDTPLELTLYESSHDLLENESLQVDPRPEDQIPTPFVLNDAIVVKKTLRYE